MPDYALLFNARRLHPVAQSPEQRCAATAHWVKQAQTVRGAARKG